MQTLQHAVGVDFDQCRAYYMAKPKWAQFSNSGKRTVDKMYFQSYSSIELYLIRCHSPSPFIGLRYILCHGQIVWIRQRSNQTFSCAIVLLMHCCRRWPTFASFPTFSIGLHTQRSKHICMVWLLNTFNDIFILSEGWHRIWARRVVHVKLVSNSRVTMFNSLWPLCKMEVVNPPAFAQIIVIESEWEFLCHLNL